MEIQKTLAKLFKSRVTSEITCKNPSARMSSMKTATKLFKTTSKTAVEKFIVRKF